MSYSLFMDNVLYPVTPPSVKIKVPNQNKTLNLIHDGEINFLKTEGLADIQFDLLLPQVHYPFALYENGFRDAEYFLLRLGRLKAGKKPFQFMLSRTTPNGKKLHSTNILVSLEEYQVTEDAKDGMDVMVAVKLKEYRDFKIKTLNVEPPQPTGQVVATVTEKRQSDTKLTPKSHKVVKGDTLWNIAKTYLGNGSKYPAVYEANRTVIDRRNKGTGNPKHTIYPGQELHIPQEEGDA